MIINRIKPSNVLAIVTTIVALCSVSYADDLPLSDAPPVEKARKPKDNFEMRKYDPQTKQLLSDPTVRKALPTVKDGMSTGEKIFTEKGCALCHKDTSSRLGPSLDKIRRFYAGNQDHMVKYFKRKAKPLIDIERESMMRSQFTKLTILSDEQLYELSSFILSVKK